MSYVQVLQRSSSTPFLVYNRITILKMACSVKVAENTNVSNAIIPAWRAAKNTCTSFLSLSLLYFRRDISLAFNFFVDCW